MNTSTPAPAVNTQVNEDRSVCFAVVRKSTGEVVEVYLMRSSAELYKDIWNAHQEGERFEVRELKDTADL